MTDEGVKARQLFYEGTIAYKTADFEKAVEKFREGLDDLGQAAQGAPGLPQRRHQQEGHRPDRQAVRPGAASSSASPSRRRSRSRELLAGAEKDTTLDPFDAPRCSAPSRQRTSRATRLRSPGVPTTIPDPAASDPDCPRRTHGPPGRRTVRTRRLKSDGPRLTPPSAAHDDQADHEPTAAADRTIRVGHSPDSDDAFMFYALTHDKLDTGGLRFVHQLEDIETLNRRALNGELEVSAVSIHAFAHLADRYALLGLGLEHGRPLRPDPDHPRAGDARRPAGPGRSPSRASSRPPT